MQKSFMSNFNWRQGYNGYVHRDVDFFIVVSDLDLSPVPLFCPICDFPIKTSEDIHFYKKSECCEHCYLKFVEHSKDSWAKGERPSKDQLDAYLKLRRQLAPKIVV